MYKSCPRCSEAVKLAGQTLFCRCGWSYSKVNHNKNIQKKVVFSLFLSTCLFSAILFYFFQWGKHGLSIITADSKQKLKICMDLKKYDCVEDSYQNIFNQSGDIKVLSQLGKFQFQRSRYAEAKQTYSQYFAKGGKDYRAAHYYAHTLVKTNNLEEAIIYFEAVLKSTRTTLMVTVIESYLDVLVSHNRMQKAKEVLARVKEMAKNSENTQSQIMKWEKKFNI